MISSLKGKELYVLDCFAGADPQYRLPVRVINEYAWHNLFARNLFIIDPAAAHVPEFTVIDVPSFRADPKRHGTRGETVIAVNFAKKLVLIGSTSYAGEMKKSIFSILNYILPLRGVLSMHCSANLGAAGDTALFFGLSGTGKTTLSSDPERMLIGDDEHGWSDRGIFNFEGGCYAKTIKLSAEAEPADLRDHAPVRDRPRKRGRRPGNTGARSRRRPAHREHARRATRSTSSTTPSPRGRADIRRTS